MPALYLDVVDSQGAEGFDEGLCEAHVGHQRDVVVYGSTADAIAVCELSAGVVLRLVDDEVELMLGNGYYRSEPTVIGHVVEKIKIANKFAFSLT